MILREHGRATRWARLLPLEPRPKAPEVEKVAARELLRAHPSRRSARHVFSADDAHVVAGFEFLRGAVREPLVEIRGDFPVSDELADATAEIAKRHVQVAHQVHGQAVVREDDEEEGEVDEQMHEIRHELEIKHECALVIPPPVHPVVDSGDEVPRARGAHLGRQDDVLEAEEEEHGGTHAERVRDGVVEEGDVKGDEHGHEGDDAEMREARDRGRGLDVLDAIAAEPVEDLDEEQGDEHDDELDVELVAEDGHGEAGLHDSVLSALVQALDLRLAKLTEEDGLKQVAEAQREREREVSHDHDRELGRRQVEHGGEVLLAGLHGVVHETASHQEGTHHVFRERHGSDRGAREATPRGATIPKKLTSDLTDRRIDPRARADAPTTPGLPRFEVRGATRGM